MWRNLIRWISGPKTSFVGKQDYQYNQGMNLVLAPLFRVKYRGAPQLCCADISTKNMRRLLCSHKRRNWERKFIMTLKNITRNVFGILIVYGLLLSLGVAVADDKERTDKIPTDKKWSERMALTLMQQHPEAWRMMGYKLLSAPTWDYPYGLTLLSMQKLYQETGDKRYLQYGKTYMDQLIDKQGNIKGYEIYNFSLDYINNGKLLFLLHKEYKDDRYLKAMKTLRTQLEWQPRTHTGGFWHKRWYPYQMWLDGLYMGASYWAQYAREFNEPTEVFSDIAHQFILVESKTRDPKTGLLYHAWDESKLQQWADTETGRSHYFWSRALGWYAMALVDTLEYFPEDHEDYGKLVAVLNRLAKALVSFQHESGLWYQVTDQGDRFGNYLETSGTAMVSYAIAKGVKQGYLPKEYLKVAQKAHDGLVSDYIKINPANNELNLIQTVGGTGLGNVPYRPGTFDYYVSEAIRTNDPHGIGPFILASLELGR